MAEENVENLEVERRDVETSVREERVMAEENVQNVEDAAAVNRYDARKASVLEDAARAKGVTLQKCPPPLKPQK